MEHKIAQFGNKGMSQDTSISKSSNELVFENRNIRITAREDGTLLSVTNEIGPSEYVGPDTQIEIEGVYYGYCDCGDSIVLFFQHDSYSTICKLFCNEFNILDIDYLIKDEDSINLNFSAPIETTFYYEREDVQKVYWVDGVNPVRVINIADTERNWDETSFDFVPVVNSVPSIDISKTYGGAGLFPAGVIQYFLSYYNKYGQESKIIQASDLNYTSFQDRGAKPDETVNCNFEITLSDLDQSFDYVRIYSVKRTAVDGPLEVHIVADVPVSSGTVTVIDTNLNQEAIDSSLLYFIGGDAFIASTIEQKDNVLFLGDIETNLSSLPSSKIEEIQAIFEENEPITVVYKNLVDTVISEDYVYTNQLKNNSTKIKGFKGGEFYRIGLQFQNKYGQWLEPFWVQDIQIDKYPIINQNSSGYEIPKLFWDNSSDLASYIDETLYPNYRFVMIEPTSRTRKIIAQGVINPTIFNIDDRRKGRAIGFSSWITRPFNSKVRHKHMESLGPTIDVNQNTVRDFSEIQNIQNSYRPYVCNFPPVTVDYNYESQGEQFYIDSSIITLNSPELSQDADINVNENSIKFNICGLIKTKSYYRDYELFYNNPVSENTKAYKPLAKDSKALIREPLLKDNLVTGDNTVDSNTLVDYYTHLYAKSGSLIGLIQPLSGQNVLSTTINHKIISNYTYGDITWYYPIVSDNIPRFAGVWRDETIIPLHNNLFYSGNYEKLSVADEPYYVYYNDGNEDYVNVPQLDPVYIKHKSSPHFVIGLPNNEFSIAILPMITGINSVNSQFEGNFGDVYCTKYTSYKINKNEGDPYQYDLNDGEYQVNYLWKDVLTDYVHYQPSEKELYPSLFNSGDEFLFIGEIVKNNIQNANDLYGSNSVENLKKYKWIPICKPLATNGGYMDDSEGDTYFQRWECLRTYPTTEDDENSVIDIVSFMVETHINLDGRDDINRGPYNLLTKRPTNTNLFNDVYNQTNNIFEYNITDLASSESGEVISKFSNQFAWSLAKSPLQQVDAWTNITMSAIQQVNGQYGPINEITKLGDTLVLFQDHAICTIDFNNRTQISTEQGLPIELANSGKVQGISYITTMYGCKNKHSIVNTKTGIYFIDDNNQAFLNISKEGIKDVSTSAGMSVWFTKNIDFGSKWTGGLLNKGFVCKYDEKFGDIYIMNNKNCIVYNELLQTFTSFFDTYRYPGMWSLNENLFALGGSDNTNVQVYKLFAGDYSSNYSITYKVNPEPYTDKIFTNLDLIADRYDNSSSPDDESGILDTSVLPFTNIKVWNEYQNTGDVTLTEEKYTPSIYKNKFRIRHIQLPRCIKADSKYKLDRIRNPWTFIKLSSSGDSTSKLQYHNMTVHYYE